MAMSFKEEKEFVVNHGKDFKITVYYNRYNFKVRFSNISEMKDKYSYEQIEAIRHYVESKLPHTVFGEYPKLYRESFLPKIESYLFKEKKLSPSKYEDFLYQLYKTLEDAEEKEYEVEHIGKVLIKTNSVKYYYRDYYLNKYITMRVDIRKNKGKK